MKSAFDKLLSLDEPTLRGLAGFASQMGEAGAASPVRTGLGRAVGRGLQGFASAHQAAKRDAIKARLLAQQEAKGEQERLDREAVQQRDAQARSLLVGPSGAWRNPDTNQLQVGGALGKLSDDPRSPIAAAARLRAGDEGADACKAEPPRRCWGPAHGPRHA